MESGPGDGNRGPNSMKATGIPGWPGDGNRGAKTSEAALSAPQWYTLNMQVFQVEDAISM
ncbi:hypothetical protein DIPPA_02519 [Diplonema papillatum]|nr:hypothetical protein DIPPA_02519 [Diplonema papillatum]